MSTPMLEHYLTIKEQYKDCIIFYRLGDFYEMFFDDAKEVSRVLDLTLTSRGGAPMCGVPYHSSETYLAKLINAGYKVAICEQLTEPSKGKMVERDVIRVITPGTVIEDAILEEGKNNYIMSVFAQNNQISLCYADITTGEFNIELLNENLSSSFSDVLTRVMPKEVLGNSLAKDIYQSLSIQKLGILPRFTLYFDWAFSIDRCEKNLRSQFGENYSKVFDLE